MIAPLMNYCKNIMEKRNQSRSIQAYGGLIAVLGEHFNPRLQGEGEFIPPGFVNEDTRFQEFVIFFINAPQGREVQPVKGSDKPYLFLVGGPERLRGNHVRPDHL
jgi:hypothetical protein